MFALCVVITQAPEPVKDPNEYVVVDRNSKRPIVIFQSEEAALKAYPKDEIWKLAKVDK